jgi:hypothetical protein
MDGASELAAPVPGCTSLTCRLPVGNATVSVGVSTDSDGVFNFGILKPSGNRDPCIERLGNFLGAA